jgi:DNA-binding MarR family transcriptional regulator
MNEHADPDETAPGRIVDQPTWLISRAYARANALLNGGFEEHGAGLRKYHYRLLAGLEEHGPTSQAQLGRGTKVDRSDVVAVLNDLEQQRLVKRAVDPANRTRNIVSITRAGSQRLRELDAVIAGVQERLLAPLSPTERDRFLGLLRRVIEG